MDIGKFKNISDWYEAAKKEGYSVPLQLRQGLQMVMEILNLSLSGAFVFLLENEKVVLSGKIYLYDLSANKTWIEQKKESLLLQHADDSIQTKIVAPPEIKTVIPTKCHFWTKELLENDDISGHYEIIEMYQDTNHTERSLVKCKNCGQLYYYDYHEEVIWGKGDFHYSTFIPINNDKETIDRLKNLSSLELLMVQPRLQWDADPKDNVTIRWQR